MAHENLTRDGFLRAQDMISSDHIHQLTSIVEQAIGKNEDDLLLENGKPIKLLYSFDKDPLFTKLLVSDPFIKLMIENCDDPTAIVPTWEDIVLKQPFSQSAFNVHQDLPLQSTQGNTFSIATYLHSSESNPVWFLPGSHQLGPLTRTQITELYEEQKDKFIPVIANAGDVILHYAKTVHFSLPHTSPNPRYTWYVEFRTLQQLFDDSPWDKEWIYKRRAIFIDALKKYNPKRLVDLAPDYDQLKPYLDNIQLKVPHVTSTVDYDMESPYYHF